MYLARRYLFWSLFIVPAQVRTLTSDIARYRNSEYIALCFYDIYARKMPISSLSFIGVKPGAPYSSIIAALQICMDKFPSYLPDCPDFKKGPKEHVRRG